MVENISEYYFNVSFHMSFTDFDLKIKISTRLYIVLIVIILIFKSESVNDTQALGSNLPHISCNRETN